MITELSATELASRLDNDEALILIDVREAHELVYGQINDSHHIPLGDLPNALDDLNPQKPTVFICRYQAAQLASDAGFSETYNLTGGMNQWATDVDPDMDVY